MDAKGKYYPSSDTIIALATPNGIGAIGVIRLSGPDAINIVSQVFKGKNLLEQASHTIHVGTIIDGDKLIDEVLVSLFIAPKSYTRENIVELSCHGSPYIIQCIMHLLIQKGARVAKPGEFTLRAFLNGQLDLSQAEAVADLIASDSKASHQVALQQLRGGFSKELQNLREQLIHFASLMELELDFAEEDVAFADRDQLRQFILSIKAVISNLIQSFALGNAIKSGVNTVIAGRPNAGKSTLLNALLNEERAIVSPIPGTTRDTIEEVLNIHGLNFRLIDTAGLREATNAIELMGIQKTMEKIHQSALLLYLFDAHELSHDEFKLDVAHLQCQGIPMLIVANKMDLCAQPLDATAYPIPERVKWIAISAKEKTHIDELKQVLYDMFLQKKSTQETSIVTNIRHFEALQKMEAALNRILSGIDHALTTDLLVTDMKQALHFLGELTGNVTTDDLLTRIFSKFCIGK